MTTIVVNAYSLGYQAFLQGRTLRSNPFTFGTKLDLWADGYRAAQDNRKAFR